MDPLSPCGGSSQPWAAVGVRQGAGPQAQDVSQGQPPGLAEGGVEDGVLAERPAREDAGFSVPRGADGLRAALRSRETKVPFG